MPHCTICLLTYDLFDKQVAEAQRQVYDTVDHEITEWGIEHNEEGLRADAYLYCLETRCPECKWTVPLVPSLVVGFTLVQDNSYSDLGYPS